MNTPFQLFNTRAVAGLYRISCLLFFIALAYNHYRLITFETPLDYNEAGMLTVTDTIAAGQNPYALQSQPTRTNVYPALYNVVVAPLSKVFGNTLVLHRTVTAVFILASCLLCFAMVYRESHSIVGSFAASCVFYAGLLYYSTPIAGPTGIGIFLFLCSIVLPWLCNFSTRSLCLAILLGILAFYAKQYFVASLGFIALYLFLAESKSKGFIFGLTSLAVFLVVLLAVHVTSPYFLDNTIFAQGYAATLASSNSALAAQYIEFGKVYSPLLLLLGIALLINGFRKRTEASVAEPSIAGYGIGNAVNFRNLHAPLLGRKLNYVWYCFFCSLIVITFSLGRNAANHLSYFFQLLSPFLLAGTVAIATRRPEMRWLYQLLMIATFYKTYMILQHDYSINEDGWRKIRQEMSAADDIYSSSILLSEIMHSGKAVYENGHTRYFLMAHFKPSFFAQSHPDQTPGAIWTRHVERIREKMKAQEFDLILLDNWMVMPEDLTGGSTSTDLLQKYYYRSATINLSLAKRPGGGGYSIHVWKPIQQNKDASE